MIGRRGLLGAAFAAPAIVRAGSLMALPLGPNFVHKIEFYPPTGHLMVSERCRYRGVAYGLGYAMDPAAGAEYMHTMDRALRKSMRQAIEFHWEPHSPQLWQSMLSAAA